MPQIFQVLRCYKCLTFQVHQTKKSNKFACKICDENQSIKRHYGIGIAKDCRMHVQKLNKMRGEKDETKLGDVSDEYEATNTSNIYEDTSDTADVKKTSKWLSYIDTQIEETDIDESQIIPEKKYYKNNKRWPINNKYKNYKAKKNFTSKHCNVNDENNLNDVIEELPDIDNNKNVFGKRPLFENIDECRIVNKVSKPTSHHFTKFQIKNSEFEDNNVKEFTTINKSAKLVTPEVNKSSKWAQFIEKNKDIVEENCDDEAVEHVTKNIQPLFNLCDESDIDEVLDI